MILNPQLRLHDKGAQRLENDAFVRNFLTITSDLNDKNCLILEKVQSIKG
jgi:hypothetical protein